ncbi:MAG TPA: hypothetical protein VF811_14410 [Parasulfuritortus sp.]
MPHASSAPLAEQEWNDGRFWFSLILTPLGMLAWARAIPLGLYVLLEHKSVLTSWARFIGVKAIFILTAFVSIWLIIAGIQSYFLEPFEIFIVRWARYRQGSFDLKGYFFKETRFDCNDVITVEKFVADTHWFGPPGSWRYGTNLTRSKRMRCNYSLKVSLKDDRVFYFPGEMFEKEGPEELLKRLKPDSEWLAALQTQPKPETTLVPNHLAYLMSEEEKNALVISNTLDSRVSPIEPDEAIEGTPKEQVIEMPKATGRHAIGGMVFDLPTTTRPDKPT